MEQLLSRGCRLSPDARVTKMIAEGEEWQIYQTNIGAYALAVCHPLFDRWVEMGDLPTGIFLEDEFPGCRVFLSTKNYLVSSMEQGPYPWERAQIEAFSIAFKTATDLFANVDLQDAIYLEEYSLLLPTSFKTGAENNGIAYGKWLTGGVGVSISSYDRVCRLMTWLPDDLIAYSAELAGFEVQKTIENHSAEEEDHKNVLVEETAIVENATSLNEGAPFSLVGRPELEQFFNDNIIDIVTHQEQYKRMGISFPGATILYGPPGCGKTYAVEKLAEYLGWKRFDIDSSTIASSYIHDTSKKISEVFRSAINAAPSVLVIDEMEAFLSDRGMAGPTGTHHVEEVAEFLRRIPEAISKGVLVFAMTNMIDSIDPAILRRGRFDHIIEVKMATAEEIDALLHARFKDLPVSEDIDTMVIAQELAGRPLSDVTFILREAGRFAVKNNQEVITKECFDAALGLLPKKAKRPVIGF